MPNRPTLLALAILSLTPCFSTLAQANSLDGVPALESLNQLGELHLSLPNIQTFQTDNGIDVLFTPLHELPIVDVTLSFDAGASHDGFIDANAQGIANMAATLLTKGTKNLSEDEFIAKKESLGIELAAGADKDFVTMSLRSLSDKNTLKNASELMVLALTEPAFDNITLSRQKDQLTTSLKQRYAQPNYVAGVTFTQAIFGTHPYALPATGTPESIANITSDHLRTYKERYLVASNAKLIITGDLTLTDAKALANALTRALPQGQKAEPLPKPSSPSPRHIHIDHPSNQTSILIGQLSEKANNDPTRMQEFTNLSIANDVLAGGDFNARLMSTIREQKGYTYGIYGNFSPLTYSGIYAISFSTKNEQAANAIADALAVINDTTQTGITANELELTRHNQKNGFPSSLASNANIHSITTQMAVRNLPISHLAERLQRLDSATLADVNTALKQHIQPNTFVVVTVGSQAPDLSTIIASHPQAKSQSMTTTDDKIKQQTKDGATMTSK